MLIRGRALALEVKIAAIAIVQARTKIAGLRSGFDLWRIDFSGTAVGLCFVSCLQQCCNVLIVGIGKILKIIILAKTNC